MRLYLLNIKKKKIYFKADYCFGFWNLRNGICE